MGKLLLLVAEWVCILLALLSSVLLLFGQLYIIQFIILAYVLQLLTNPTGLWLRPKIPAYVIISITVLSALITIWMGYKTDMGFKAGNHYYGAPSRGTIILSILDLALMIVTLALYSKVLRRTRGVALKSL